MVWIAKLAILLLSAVFWTSGTLLRSQDHVKARQSLLMFLGIKQAILIINRVN